MALQGVSFFQCGAGQQEGSGRRAQAIEVDGALQMAWKGTSFHRKKYEKNLAIVDDASWWTDNGYMVGVVFSPSQVDWRIFVHYSGKRSYTKGLFLVVCKEVPNFWIFQMGGMRKGLPGWNIEICSFMSFYRYQICFGFIGAGLKASNEFKWDVPSDKGTRVSLMFCSWDFLAVLSSILLWFCLVVLLELGWCHEDG